VLDVEYTPHENTFLQSPKAKLQVDEIERLCAGIKSLSLWTWVSRHLEGLIIFIVFCHGLTLELKKNTKFFTKDYL